MIVERWQPGKDRPGVRCDRESRRIQTGERRDVFDAARGEDDVDRLLEHGFGTLERGAGRKLHDADQIALILLGDEARRRPDKLKSRQPDQHCISDQHDAGDLHQPARQSPVGRRQPFEAAVERAEAPAHSPGEQILTRAFVGFARFEQHRAQRRAQRQGHETRYDGGRRDGDGELPEEQPGNSGDEGGRNENRAKRQGNGNQRAADLVHGGISGVAGAEPPLQIALDIFHHDDRVIDHDADGKDETEQRQIIERYAEHVEDGEGADQRYRNGDHRNDGGAPILQKQADHPDDQQYRDEDGADDFADRLADENRRIVDDLVAHTRRKILGERFHRREDFVLDFERVRAGLGEYQQRQARSTIRERGRAVVCRADFDAADIAHAGDPPFGVRLQHDIGKLLGSGQPSQRLNVELIGVLRRRRRLIENARGYLDVLRPQRGEHVAGAEVARGNLVGVEPDPHGIFAAAQKLHVADARQPRQRVFDMERRVIRQIERVARSIRRI